MEQKLKINEYTFLQENNFEQARKRIQETKGRKIIFSSQKDEINRKILEKQEIFALLLSQQNRKDRMKQRNSGFNQVLMNIAKKRRVRIAIDLDELINEKNKAQILARVQQNVILIKKGGLEVIFVHKKKNTRDEKSIKSLGLVLGLPTKTIKNAKIIQKP